MISLFNHPYLGFYNKLLIVLKYYKIFQQKDILGKEVDINMQCDRRRKVKVMTWPSIPQLMHAI